jgi:acyl-CoA thioesterase FadM
MKEDRFVPPQGAFSRTVPIRFSHCDPAGIVYFPHYFGMFNGLIEDWYTEQLGVDYAVKQTARLKRIDTDYCIKDVRLAENAGHIEVRPCVDRP